MMDQEESQPSLSVGIRRTHKKSRTGCKTCRLRHIRCDETYPQCRNCKKGNRLCSYNLPKLESPSPSDGLPIYPHLDVTFFRPVETRLLRHAMDHEAESGVLSHNDIYSLWVRKLPRMVPRHRFVLDGLLGVSAAHLNLLTETTQTAQLALYYRSQAMSGLQQAVSNFTEENADAVAACSILLTWFQCDWNEWASLTRGFKALMISMKPYQAQSSFIDIIQEEEIIPEEMQPLPPHSTESKLPAAEDIEALGGLRSKLLEVKEYVAGHRVEESMIDQYIEFVSMLQATVPIKSPEEQFLTTKMLRTAMAAVPVGLMNRVRREPEAMMAVAFFFVTVLVTQPMFPAMGTMFFARKAFSPINEISKYLNEQRNHPVAAKAHDWTRPVEFMGYATETVRWFRAKLGWPSAL